MKTSVLTRPISSKVSQAIDPSDLLGGIQVVPRGFRSGGGDGRRRQVLEQPMHDDDIHSRQFKEVEET